MMVQEAPVDNETEKWFTNITIGRVLAEKTEQQ